MLRMLAVVLIAILPFTASAKTLRWSSQGDISTFDPHGQDETFTKSNQALIYERLLLRGKDMSLQSGLAVEWKNTGPTTWVLKLRPNVKWHDGSDFSADDVVFSVDRAAKSKQFRTYAQPVGTVKKIDNLTVEFTTPQPNPVTLINISEIPVMSKAWAEKNNAVPAQDPASKEQTFAVRNAMGTGAFTLVSYEPGVKTVFKKNPNWWGLKEGRFTSNVEMVEYRPIANGATRMAALKSGELDFVLDPSVQDIEPLKRDKELKVWEGDETRIIMIALDQARDELLFSDVKGKNPFKDKRVRQALYHAVDINAIHKTVMRGLSKPTAIPLPDPKGEGIDPALDKRLAYDVAKGKQLLAEAGYPNGFGFTLHCPNDRYVNDEKICVALAAMWAKIGLNVKVDAMPKAQYFQRTPKKEFSACMQGWGSNARDAIFTLKPVLHSFDEKSGWGDTNYGNYKNEELDKIIKAAEVEMDSKKRGQLINDAVRVIQKETLILPLHRQITPWVSRTGMKVVHRIDNWFVPHWANLP